MTKKIKSPKHILFLPWDKNGIPLSEVLAVHEQFRPRHALPDNLGDGFLLTMNPIYRNLRAEFVKRGFSFTQKDFCFYFSFPLMSLDDALEARKIPYRNNFHWLKLLEERAPGQFTLTELKRSELQFNYLFHESAHFIAHSVFFGDTPPRKVAKNSDSLLKILLGEAFANAVECISSVFAEGEIGSYFLDANCHYRASEKEVRLIRSSAEKFGYAAVVRVLMAAFLYSNFLYEKVGSREKKQIRDFSLVREKKSIDTLLRIGLQLCEQFRTTTTHLHLVKTGFPADLDKQMRFDPLARLLKKENIALRDKAYLLAEIACRGL